jgi:sucrose-6F-phosphate phosphohydrolase
MSPFLFVTDLDNTLVGDDTALHTLNQYLSQHRQQYGTQLVYATGRSLYLYRKLAAEKSLLPPDALIAAVGTEIYFDLERHEIDPAWREILSPGWDRDLVCATASHFADLVLQPESEQNPFKVSFYLTEPAAAEVLPRLEIALAQHGLETKLIYSSGQDLDILPSRGNKGLAVQYLRQKWNAEPQKTVVCGDSGNDIDLLGGEERGIIVGNARPELRQWYHNHRTPFRYLAQAAYARGILEGLKHFAFL